jgi:N-acyl-D-aspartate/D-glutamate deacylase
MATYDLVIRGGTVVDGSGGEPFVGNVAVKDGRIAAVGAVPGTGAEEIEATGLIVTPGFVDIHTHYDGQVTWSERLAPSSDHGVTTVVMGNCGVGFAPMKAHQRDTVIAMMEGVEDIPGAVMAEGVPFNWETFPDYLDALEQRRSDMDFCAQLPHSPLRVYVMGERGIDQPATDADLAEMRRLVAEAMEAGALGVTTSRTLAHRFRDGRPAPSVHTPEDELLALADGLRDAGKGVFQAVPNTLVPAADEFAVLRHIAERSGRPLSFTLMAMGSWQDHIAGLRGAIADGLVMRGQSTPRAVSFMFGLDLTLHPFALNPSFQEITDLPLAGKVARMRDPEFRRRLLSESPESNNPLLKGLCSDTSMLFALGSPPNYTPRPEDNLAARAAASGQELMELIYDELLKDEGRAILFAPKGNVDGDDLTIGRALFDYDNVLLGLGDGGAHYGMICDAALPTWFLTDCVRDALPERSLGLAHAVKLMTRDAAQAVGLDDRGLLAPGYKADINVIDYARLGARTPEVVYDLPASGRRLIQKADGYVATIVSGEATYRNGAPTGALPGRLVRGAQPKPA